MNQIGRRLLMVAVVAMPLTMTGCAADGMYTPMWSASSSAPAAAQDPATGALYRYAGNETVADAGASRKGAYAAQMGVAGAILGGLGGLINCKARDSDCTRDILIGVGAGGAVGAGVGYGVGAAADEQALREAELNAMLSNVRGELQQAMAARDAAQRVADGHRTALQALQQQHAQGQASRKQLDDAVARARADQLQMEKAQRRLEASIAVVNQEVSKRQAQGEQVPEEMKTLLTELQGEKSKLESLLSVLAGDIATAQPA